MKKITSVLLSMIMVFLVGCSSVAVDPNETNQSTTDNDTPNEVVYTIYGTSTLGNFSRGDGNVEEDSNIKYGNISELDFLNSRTDDVVNIDAEREKTLVINGKELQFKYRRTYARTLASSKQEALSQFGYQDVYELYDENQTLSATAEFSSNNGELRFYLDFDLSHSKVDSVLTDEDAKALADELMLSIYGRELSDEYDVVVSSSDASDTNSVYVYYTRSIFGYTTDEVVRIELNGNGDLLSLNAERLRLFDSIKNELTLEMIQNAEDMLIDRISDLYTINSKTIMLDANSGKFFLRIRAVYTSELGVEGVEFFINVN